MLEYTTLVWNVVGTIVVVVAAIEARSVALAGFGLDSLIEIFASTIVVWQIRGVDLTRERPALRMIAMELCCSICWYSLLEVSFGKEPLCQT